MISPYSQRELIYLKCLKILDSIFEKFIRFMLTATMIVLTAMINILVLCRYVLHVNLGGLEEMPVFLMIMCVWLGAGLVAKNDDHVKIDIIHTVIKNDKAKAALKTAVNTLTAAVMWYYTYLAYIFVSKSMRNGDISSGTGFPLWWIHAFVLIGSFAMALYYTKNTFKEIGGIRR